MNVLVIPDIHHRTSNADAILEREAGKVDRVVFLGDYFDYHKTEESVASKLEVCEWLDKTSAVLGDKGVWLAGNHDIHYHEELLQGIPYPRSGHHPFKKYKCSGYNRDTAKKILNYFKTGDHPFWAGMRIQYKVGDILMSHAGIHPRRLISFLSLDENLHLIEKEWSRTKSAIRIDHHPSTLYDIGHCRGGSHEIGGILWQDWDHEFIETPGITQIVGHTYHPTPQIIGKSVSLDTGCNYYAKIIDEKFIDIYNKHGAIFEYE